VTNGRNAHLTFKGNVGVGRHGWLRLTPAYSVSLVRGIVHAYSADVVVTDPFSGTGTTALAAAEHGGRGQAVDLNPFLIWLGNAKLARYPDQVIGRTQSLLAEVLTTSRDLVRDPALWRPAIFRIERWWSESALRALAAIRAAIDCIDAGPSRDLLEIALCRTLIGLSNAAFDHQSMSFRSDAVAPVPFEIDAATRMLGRFGAEAEEIVASAAIDLPGSGEVVEGDARNVNLTTLAGCDLLLTSPPYVNRMSYIRELRPYMYWLRYIEDAAEAGDLDWRAIGGTWGVATSRLDTWSTDETTPVAAEMQTVCQAISRDGGRSGPRLSAYVHKYFDDMWTHFQAAFKHVRSGGTATYIVGNSTFYGHLVPAERWYAAMLREVGFVDVSTKNIRKRNSNARLFEFDVSAVRP
jgi:hypothetical protein